MFVQSYHGNRYENTLSKLKVYLLKNILDCHDIREVIKRDFYSNVKHWKVIMTSVIWYKPLLLRLISYMVIINTNNNS